MSVAVSTGGPFKLSTVGKKIRRIPVFIVILVAGFRVRDTEEYTLVLQIVDGIIGGDTAE